MEWFEKDNVLSRASSFKSFRQKRAQKAKIQENETSSTNSSCSDFAAFQTNNNITGHQLANNISSSTVSLLKSPLAIIKGTVSTFFNESTYLTDIALSQKQNNTETKNPYYEINNSLSTSKHSISEDSTTENLPKLKIYQQSSEETFSPEENTSQDSVSSSSTSILTTDSIRSQRGSSSKTCSKSTFDGEWNNFWRNYNHVAEIIEEKPKKDSIKRPSLHEKKSPQIQKVIMSTSDAIEAACCARRLSDILSKAIRRSSLPSKNVTKKEIQKLRKFRTVDYNNCNDETDVESSNLDCPPLVKSKSDSNIINSETIKNNELIQKINEKNNKNFVEIELNSSDSSNMMQIFCQTIQQRRNTSPTNL